MSKKSGWAKLFVTDENDDKTATTTTEETLPKKPAARPVSVSSVNSVKPTKPTPSLSGGGSTTATASSLTKEFASYFDEFFKEANFPGPDYYEFITAIKELEAEAMEEKAKFISVFMGFKVQGVSKQNLIDAANKYIALIEQQKADFKVDVQSKINGEVAEKQNKAEQLKAENEQIEQQMQDLADKKNQNAEALKKLKTEISDDTAALNMKQLGFDGAADEFVATINENIDKIKRYLPEGKPAATATAE